MTLDHPSLPEAVISLADGVEFGPAKDDMVDQLDINGSGRLAEAAGDLEVGRGRGRVAGRVVVLCCVPSYVE